MSTPSTAFAGPPHGKFGRPRPPVAPVATQRPTDDAADVSPDEIHSAPQASVADADQAEVTNDPKDDKTVDDAAHPADGRPEPSTVGTAHDEEHQALAAADTTSPGTDSKREAVAPSAAIPDAMPAVAPSGNGEPKKRRGRGQRAARKTDPAAPGKLLVVINGGVATPDDDSIVVIDLDTANDADDAHEVVALLESLRGVNSSALRDSTLNTLKELVVDKALQ